MLQAQVIPSTTPQSKEGPVDKIDLTRQDVGVAPPSAKHIAVFVIGSARLLINFCIVSFLIIIVTPAFAQEQERTNNVSGVAMLPVSDVAEVTSSAFGPVLLPSLDSIDAQTDITVFLQGGVPAELRLAALR